jgi:hypothetical protein
LLIERFESVVVFCRDGLRLTAVPRSLFVRKALALQKECYYISSIVQTIMGEPGSRHLVVMVGLRSENGDLPTAMIQCRRVCSQRHGPPFPRRHLDRHPRMYIAQLASDASITAVNTGLKCLGRDWAPLFQHLAVACHDRYAFWLLDVLDITFADGSREAEFDKHPDDAAPFGAIGIIPEASPCDIGDATFDASPSSTAGFSFLDTDGQKMGRAPLSELFLEPAPPITPPPTLVQVTASPHIDGGDGGEDTIAQDAATFPVLPTLRRGRPFKRGDTRAAAPILPAQIPLARASKEDGEPPAAKRAKYTK